MTILGKLLVATVHTLIKTIGLVWILLYKTITVIFDAIENVFTFNNSTLTFMMEHYYLVMIFIPIGLIIIMVNVHKIFDNPKQYYAKYKKDSKNIFKNILLICGFTMLLIVFNYRIVYLTIPIAIFIVRLFSGIVFYNQKIYDFAIKHRVLIKRIIYIASILYILVMYVTLLRSGLVIKYFLEQKVYKF